MDEPMAWSESQRRDLVRTLRLQNDSGHLPPIVPAK